MSEEPIAEEILVAARLRTKRKVAAMLVSALAVSGEDAATIDARLGQKAGWTIAYIVALVDGKTKDFDIISDLCFAMNVEMHFSFSQIERVVVQVEESRS